jgi:hypothetical protein
MTVIHSTASAQSRVATLHLVVHELLVFLVVLVAIEMPASVTAEAFGGGTKGWRSCRIGRRTWQ